MTKIIFTPLFLAALTLNIAQADNRDDIRARVQKVGALNIDNSVEKSDNQTSAAAKQAPSNASPADHYQAKCFACHGTGAAGAPILGDKAAWKPRIANGFDTINQNARNGIGGMPPRGGTTLDDNAITAIVEYMIENSQ